MNANYEEETPQGTVPSLRAGMLAEQGKHRRKLQCMTFATS